MAERLDRAQMENFRAAVLEDGALDALGFVRGLGTS